MTEYVPGCKSTRNEERLAHPGGPILKSTVDPVLRSVTGMRYGIDQVRLITKILPLAAVIRRFSPLIGPLHAVDQYQIVIFPAIP